MGQFAAEAWGAKEAPMTVEQSMGGVTNVVCGLSAEEEEANELTGHLLIRSIMQRERRRQASFCRMTVPQSPGRGKHPDFVQACHKVSRGRCRSWQPTVSRSDRVQDLTFGTLGRLFEIAQYFS